MQQPLPGAADPWSEVPDTAGDPVARPSSTPERPAAQGAPTAAGAARAVRPQEGRVVGQFRNTYYDFPSEADYEGTPVSLLDQSCVPIKKVPVDFHDALCVQGSGNLQNGITVSFAKRDCECARTCPRTGQKICYEALNPGKFPWGRGALGKPITPLLTVAVDDAVIPMQTVLYIPEFDGLPRDQAQTKKHDGCFVAQDRGLKVKGQHVDVFTGKRSVTELWNRLVPSNSGVTVVLDAPHCANTPRSAG